MPLLRIMVVSTPVFQLGIRGLVGYGGLEQVAYQCAAGLAAKGHTVSLVAPDGSQCPGVEVIPTGPAMQHNEQQAYQKYAELLPKFDVIIDHSWMKFPYIAKMQGLRVPVLGVMHAPVNTMYQSLPPVEKPSFVCISKDQASHFQALFGVEAKVAYNGIDLDFYRPLDIPRSNRFLFLARFSPEKGADIAIQACRQVGVGLDLVGDTSIIADPQYFEQCKKMVDGKQIRMIGPASRGSCVWWFSQAHCLIHPNQRFREPFGLAPVEALACGSPVIAWDFGAMSETVSKGVGWLVKSYDELCHAVETTSHEFNSPTGKKQRLEYQEWASQFSLQNMVDRYEELAIEAVDTGGW